jgi:hypothetical protein
MRSPGENAAGQAPGRRQSPSGQDVPPRPGQGTGRSQPGGESSLFTPGYRDGRQAAAEPAGDAPRPGSGYGWAGGAASKGPVRGFPPAPGQPPPLYPPGQFSAWNHTSWAEADGQADDAGAGLPWGAADQSVLDHAGTGYVATAGAAGGEQPDTSFEPGYSDLAVSDPAADATSTQTWGAVDGIQTGTWTSQRPPGDGRQAGDGRAPGDGRQAGGWTSRRAPGDGPPPGGPPPGGPPAGRAQQPPVRAAGDAGGPQGPAPAGRPGLADGASGPDSQPGRARGHGTGAHSSRTGPQPRRKPSRRLLAAGLAVLVALSGGTYVLLRGGHGSAAADPAAKPTLPHASSSPAASTPTPTPTPTGQWGHIESRAADPLPMTLAEVFPAAFTADAAYRRTVSRQGKNCSTAVVGGQLQQAVRQPGCSQVLRASYLAVSKKLMGTIGVLNLTTFKAAEKAGKSAGPAEFIAQLAAAKGPTRNLTKGTGIEQADVKGHYLILVWAEFTTLHEPKSKKQRKELEAFLTLLIRRTANVSLTSRMVTGKP